MLYIAKQTKIPTVWKEMTHNKESVPCQLEVTGVNKAKSKDLE